MVNCTLNNFSQKISAVRKQNIDYSIEMNDRDYMTVEYIFNYTYIDVTVKSNSTHAMHTQQLLEHKHNDSSSLNCVLL